MRKFTIAALLSCSAVISWTGPAGADAGTYRATFVENPGGPEQPAECAPGTSCGSVSVPGVGTGTSVLTFGACGAACHVREITFSDGATMTMHEYPQGPFHSEGRAGDRGYIGFGLPGNPQRQEIDQVIVAGTGRLAGVTGEGTGVVKVAGGSAVIKTTGSIDLPWQREPTPRVPLPQIVKAIEGDRARVLAGPDARAVDLVARILPGRSGLIGRLTNRAASATRRGAASGAPS